MAPDKLPVSTKIVHKTPRSHPFQAKERPGIQGRSAGTTTAPTTAAPRKRLKLPSVSLMIFDQLNGAGTIMLVISKIGEFI
jgi:hypothetical protein